MPDRVVSNLRPLLSKRRAARVEEVLVRRLKGVAVLLEGLYDHGNRVAVMRTSEALGLLRVHWVRVPSAYKPAKKVGQGAPKWLDLREHSDLPSAVRYFREGGYRIVGSDLSATATLEEIDVSTPLVLVFGNEREGISPALREACDATYKIPMAGFSQSLNISCAAAISLYVTAGRYRERLAAEGDLDRVEREALRALYYRRTVRRSELLVGEGPDTVLP